jgi:uncharacterized protein YdaU (DUF1376 family)
MHYYPHHIGDYQRDTATLSLAEHGAYRLLMDAYYVGEAPLPDDHTALCRIVRAMTKAERDAVATVMAAFFKSKDGKLVHKRIAHEIAAYKANADKNRENGKKGGRPPKQKPTENPVGFVSLTQPETQSVTQTKGNQEPGTNNHFIPHTQGASAGEQGGFWPDPSEYPTVQTVRQWAESVMAPAECADKWHAQRVIERWQTHAGRPMSADVGPLRALFNTYATSWKARASQQRTNGQAVKIVRPADKSDVKPTNMKQL